jgi:hypothetical protein
MSWIIILNMNERIYNLKKYPEWCCSPCGIKHGGKGVGGGTSTFHAGTCEVCEVMQYVTEPRDYGYPRFPGFDSPSKKEMPEVEALMRVIGIKT